MDVLSSNGAAEEGGGAGHPRRGPALLLVNPSARRSARGLDAAHRAFHAAGVPCEVVRTERPGHAGEVARLHEHDVRAVFVLGGDGTVMEVLGALAHTGRPVGILPGGTGNLVARSLGVPLDVGRATRSLLNGRTVPMDLGVLASGRRFAFSVSVGVDARMIAETSARAKQRFGVAAYVATATRAALAGRSFRVRAVVDGQVLERDAAEVMVANIGSVLNDWLVVGPDVRADDGLLDLCVYASGGGTAALAVVWRLARRRFTGSESLMFRRGRRFRVECDPPQVYQADGEVQGSTPFEAHIDAGAATILRPATRD